MKKDGPAVTTDRIVFYTIGAARFAVEAKPRPSSRRSLRDYSRPPAVEPEARPSSAERETTPFAWRYMHSPAYTCIHAHFSDFTCVHLRSFLLISLQLRLQLEKEASGVKRVRDTRGDGPFAAAAAPRTRSRPAVRATCRGAWSPSANRRNAQFSRPGPRA